MLEQFSRLQLIVGEQSIETLSKKTVAIFGVGGVGGYVVEALARSGVGHFVLIDNDKVCESNINRQILYTYKDIGLRKVEIAKERLLSINPDINVKTLDIKIDEESVKQIKADFIVDAIDDVNGKIAIAKYALENNIPFIVSLGMANRLDPSKVTITKLNKTTNDPLAKKIRYEFKKNNIDVSKVITVFSNEDPVVDKGKLHSMMMVPSSAGLNIANFVITYYKK